jgi:hypothetical protein
VDRWIRDNPVKEPSFPHTTSRTDFRLRGRRDLRWTGGSETTLLKSRLFPTQPLAQTPAYMGGWIFGGQVDPRQPP